jgi:hypothetical protein
MGHRLVEVPLPGHDTIEAAICVTWGRPQAEQSRSPSRSQG